MRHCETKVDFAAGACHKLGLKLPQLSKLFTSLRARARALTVENICGYMSVLIARSLHALTYDVSITIIIVVLYCYSKEGPEGENVSIDFYIFITV